MNESEKSVIETLLNWNYKTKKSNAFNVSMKADVSISHTFLILRKYSAMFWLVRRKHGKTRYYVINPKLRKTILKQLKEAR